MSISTFQSSPDSITEASAPDLHLPQPPAFQPEDLPAAVQTPPGSADLLDYDDGIPSMDRVPTASIEEGSRGLRHGYHPCESLGAR